MSVFFKFTLTTIIYVCFVLIFKIQTVEAKYIGNWELTTKINKITDKTDIIAKIGSVNKVENEVGIQKTAFIFLRCEEMKVEVFVLQPNYLVAIEPVVIERFDNGRPRIRSWHLGKDYKTTYSKKPKEFIQYLAQHTKLVLGFRPNLINLVTAEFNLTGVNEVANMIFDKCNE